MTEHTRGRPRGSGTLQRTELVSVRFDPKTRYLLELAARVQRRTISSLIEWSISGTLDEIVIAEGTPNACTVTQAAGHLWDVDAPERFVRLALHNPELMTFDEQTLWKIIQETSWLWRGGVPDLSGWWAIPKDRRINLRLQTNIDLKELRLAWDLLNKIVSGEVERYTLDYVAPRAPDPVEQPTPAPPVRLRRPRTGTGGSRDE